jgi:hypothetical protein
MAWTGVVRRHGNIIQKRMKELVDEKKLAGLLSPDAEVPSLWSIQPPVDSSDS